MPKIERVGDEVVLRMSYLDYRDLTETLTAAGNEAKHHASCVNRNTISTGISVAHAESAWAWSMGMGIPPLNDGESKEFDLEPFKYLSGPIKLLPPNKNQEPNK